MFKALKNLFDDRQHKLETVAFHVFVQLARSCPASTAARAAFDYAETFMRELDKRNRRR
jgi:hypothetical protein